MSATIAKQDLQRMIDEAMFFFESVAVQTGRGLHRFGDIMADFQRERFAALAPSLLALARNKVPKVGKFFLDGTKGASKDGDLVLRFPDCKILSCDFETQADGRTTWALTIQDTRWRWKFGRISGEYNLRCADGEPRPEAIKKPQELAKLLFAAIGVTNYDVSRLPNNVFPERIWEYARADQELAKLCEELGCRVVLSPGNKVTLWPDGVGSPLPLGNDVLDNSLAFQPMDRPDVLRFVGGQDAISSQSGT